MATFCPRTSGSRGESVNVPVVVVVAALLLLLLLLLSCCAESVYWAVKQRLNEAKKSISWPYVRAKNF